MHDQIDYQSPGEAVSEMMRRFNRHCTLLLCCAQRRQKSTIIRHEIVPITLYRVQPRLPVSLRSHASQMQLGRESFDLKLHEDGLVHPVLGDSFTGPNGMSLRPDCSKFRCLLSSFRGPFKVYTLQSGLQIPEDLLLIHEHTDHYSLQVKKSMSLDHFNSLLTDFFCTLPVQNGSDFLI